MIKDYHYSQMGMMLIFQLVLRVLVDLELTCLSKEEM